MKTAVRIRYWLTGLVLLAVIIALHVVPASGIQFYADGESFDIAHVFGFAVVAYGLTRVFMERPLVIGDRRMSAYLTAAAAACAIALIAEIAQIPTSRDASLGDLGRDLAGIAAGLLTAEATLRVAAARVAFFGLALVALALGLYAPGTSFWAKTSMRLRFPSLLTFESPLDRLVVSPIDATIRIVPAPEGWPIGGNVAAVIPDLEPGFHGFGLADIPADWSGFHDFTMTVAALEDEEIGIVLRIEDYGTNGEFNDRFNKNLTITQEPTLVRIPLSDIETAPASRRLDLSAIASVMIFTTESDAARFFVDDLRLE